MDCFFRRSGFIDDTGNFLKDVVVSSLSVRTGIKSEALEEAVGKCIPTLITPKEENNCEAAFKLFECYWTSDFAKSQPKLSNI